MIVAACTLARDRQSERALPKPGHLACSLSWTGSVGPFYNGLILQRELSSNEVFSPVIDERHAGSPTRD